jgi:phosphopantothenoylcysteine synthetase/decarboxylase
MANVILGVSAGIAIYKSVDLASKLTQRGDLVRVVMTPNALKFVTALTFRAVTRQEVYTDTFEDDPGYRPEHISLSDWADGMILAPATADLLGRLAAGLGDSLLAVTALAFPRLKPVVVAPSMNNHMWANAIVQANITRLRELLGYRFVEPGDGYLACGSVGPGRMAEVEMLLEALDSALAGR